MMFVSLLLGALLVITGAGLSIKALRGMSIVGRLLRRPTVAVSRLREGPVEVSGKVMPVGEALLSLSGHRCVAVKTTVSGWSGGEDSSSKGSKTAQRVVPTRLVDATGECKIDLEQSAIVGERWHSRTITENELAYVPWIDLVPSGSTEVTVEELIIPEGATVLVSGDASPSAKQPGYREGAGEEWSISGSPEHLLVVSIDGQARMIGRTVVLATLVLAAGAYLGALGLLMITLSLAY